MKGSEKQIAWAEKIRADVAINVEKAIPWIANYLESELELSENEISEQLTAFKALSESLMSNDNASFWIDNRGLAIGADAPVGSPLANQAANSLFNKWRHEIRKAK